MIKMIYQMPTVEIEELAVEQGFAATGVGVSIEVNNGADHEEGWA
jgi:hypothetical protein